VTERDAAVLSFLADVRVASLTGDEAGSFKLTFSFRDNPFFTNKVRPLQPSLWPLWFVPLTFAVCPPHLACTVWLASG
jgi:hypothetical protein